MSLPRIRVVRGRLNQERPWQAPETAEVNVLTNAVSGQPARLRTDFRLFHDGIHLFVAFDYDDDHVVATMFDRDEPLYNEDVLEVFISGERVEEYVEIEVSPRGSIFDARVSSPDRSRATMHVDRDWNSANLWTALRSEQKADGSIHAESVIAIPLGDIAAEAVVLRANFFRIDRHPDGDSFDAWVPTLREPPDFHVPDAFGWLDLE